MFLVLKEPKTCKASSDCEGEETCDLTLTECQCGKRDSCYGNPDGRICDAINNICKCDPKDKKSCPPGQVCRKEKCGRYLSFVHLLLCFRKILETLINIIYIITMEYIE